MRQIMTRFFRFGLLAAVVTLALWRCQSTGSKPASDRNPKKAPSEANPVKATLENGNAIAFEAQGALLSKVSQALQQGGAAYAIGYCNLKANPIIDSISKKENVVIERLAWRHRSAANYLKTKTDTTVYQNFEKEILAGNSPQPIFQTTNEGRYFYKPIVLKMEACLKCHGKPGQHLQNETLEFLNKMYPKDEAVNFALGDLRGIWKIKFN